MYRVKNSQNNLGLLDVSTVSLILLVVKPVGSALLFKRKAACSETALFRVIRLIIGDKHVSQEPRDLVATF